MPSLAVRAVDRSQSRKRVEQAGRVPHDDGIHLAGPEMRHQGVEERGCHQDVPDGIHLDHADPPAGNTAEEGDICEVGS